MICTTENSNEEPLVKSSEVAQGGGVGVIVVEIDAGGQWLYNFPISTSIIGYDDAQILDAYMGSSRFALHLCVYYYYFCSLRRISVVLTNYLFMFSNPVVSFSYYGEINVKPNPVVAHFSSRGPNMITPDIIKAGLFPFLFLSKQ